MVFKKVLTSTSVAMFVLVLAGCSSAYYKTQENLGIEKRDILVDRVEEADSFIRSMPD